MKMRARCCAVLVAFVLSLLPVSAFAAESPASIVPKDAVVYVEAGKGVVQHVVGMAAMPPVAKLFAPQMDSPFGYVNQFLRLPAGTAEAAAPHVKGLALFVVNDDDMGLIVTFDEPGWPQKLFQNAEDAGNGLKRCNVPNLLFLERGSNLVAGPEATCRRIALGDYGALNTMPGFAAARKSAEGAVLAAFSPVPALLELMRREMPAHDRDEFDVFLTISGLDHARHATLTLRTDGQPGQIPTGAALSLSLHMDGAGAGVLGLLPDGKLGTAEDVPAGAPAAFMLNWGDTGRLFGGIRDLAIQAARDAGEDEQQIRNGIAGVENMLGATLDQIFGQIGSGLSVHLKPPREGTMIGLGDWVASLRLDDADGFKGVVDRLLQMAIGAPPAMPYMDGGVPMNRLPMAPNNVLYSFTPQALVVGGSAAAVKKHVGWLDAPGRKGLLAKPPQALAMLRLDTGMLLKSYPAPKSGAKLLLTIGRKGDDIQVKLGVKDLEPTALGPAGGAIGVTGIMAAMLMPAVGKARESARGSNDRANLHHVGAGLMMYAQDHDGQFPPNLKALMDGGYLKGADIFVSPGDPNPPVRDGIKCSYDYIGAIDSKKLNPATIVVYTRSGVFREGRNVLFRDCAVTWARGHGLTNPRFDLFRGYEEALKALGPDATEERKAQLKKFFEMN